MMFSIMAGLIYLGAIAIPLWLLIRFGQLPWFVHVLAVAAALAIGLAPGTPLLSTTAGTFLYGFAFLFLLVWGIGGLIPRKTHRRMAHHA